MGDEPQRRIDGYGPEEMAIPTWVMLQPTGGDWAKGLGGKPGQFHNTGSDEIVDELNVIIVDILTGRARWSMELTDQGPLCASLDAKSGQSINGDDCEKCEYRLDTPWAVDAQERRKMCCLNYTLLAITTNDHMPCIIRAHGISALPVRQLISQLRLNRNLRGEYYRAIISIKSQEKKGKAGTAYALHPKVLEFITDEPKALEFKNESNRLLGAPIPLPEGRPEEEPEPLGFTPEGIPFYSEAERDRLIAPGGPEDAAEPLPEQEPQVITTEDVGKVEDVLAEPPAEAAAEEAAATAAVAERIKKIKDATEAADQAEEPPPEEPPPEEKKEAGKTEKALDLDF